MLIETLSNYADPWYETPGRTRIDEEWMWLAMAKARAARPDDLPFGCVIVGPEGEYLVSTAGTGNADPLAHSEMIAIHLVAIDHREPEWLRGCTLYSTHEPCPMCCGGINHAKISRVVWGSDRHDLPHLFRPKRSAAAALADTSHPPVIVEGVWRESCIALFDGIEKWD